MKIDCTKNCKKTKEMRFSKFCGQTAELVDGKIIYSCDIAYASESETVKNLLDCQLWDNDLKDSCNTCPLRCINNKNPELMISVKASMELKALLDSLKGSMVLYGVDQKTIESISSDYKKNKDTNTKNAIDAAKLSNESIKLIQKGKHVDIAYLSIASSILLKKIKKKN